MEGFEKVIKWYLSLFMVYEVLAFVAGVAAGIFQIQDFAQEMLSGIYLLIVVSLIALTMGFEITKSEKEKLTTMISAIEFGTFATLLNALVILLVGAFSPALWITNAIFPMIIKQLFVIITFSLISALVGSFLATVGQQPKGKK